MFLSSVIKIDLAGSKSFAAKKENLDPGVRKSVLEKLLSISKQRFPEGNIAYPEGAFYKAEGDAVYFLLRSPSVALRAAIEFMQDWYSQALPHYPDCRVAIEYGSFENVDVPGGTDLVSKAFENISVFEKGLEEGRIFVTHNVIDNCDQTMARFVLYGEYEPRSNEKLKVFYVNFLDPRTLDDSSLIHALFIAHPQAAEARDRIFELLVVDCLFRGGGECDVPTLVLTARELGYPLPPSAKLPAFLSKMPMVETVPSQDSTKYRLNASALPQIENARTEYRRVREECLQDVARSVVEKTRSDHSLSGVDLGSLVDDYLSAMFSEIRMMANYFRDTNQIFDSGPEIFRRFSYVLRRHLGGLDPKHFPEWQAGFLWGLKTAAARNSPYIAAVFHNVLATYYLNRSAAASPYQLDKLQKREIYLDTNVLYSLLVPASQFHELVSELVVQLRKIGVPIRVYPFTIQEYEHSLKLVEENLVNNSPTPRLVRWNPWLYQEYRLNQTRYLNSIAVCRQQYSLCDSVLVPSSAYDEIDRRLSDHGVRLERSFQKYTKDQVEDLWVEIRNLMPGAHWDLAEYWEFIYEQAELPDEVIKHDVFFVQNLFQRAHELPADELGPRVILLSLDRRKLLRLRKRFTFIMHVEQCVEFILPYLFLSDVPVADAYRFPNQILSAQLATLLVQKPPDMNEVVGMYLRRPDWFDQDIQKRTAEANRIERALSADRFKSIASQSRILTDEQKEEIAKKAASVVEEVDLAATQRYFRNRDLAPEMNNLREQLETEKTERAALEKKVDKLQKTVGYWRAQARRARS